MLAPFLHPAAPAPAATRRFAGLDATAVEPTLLTSCSFGAAEGRLFRALVAAFLAADDPYLEADALAALAESQGWEPRACRELLERCARLGWLRVAYPPQGRAGFGADDSDGEPGLAIVELTFEGLDVFCRGSDADAYARLVREVAHALVRARPGDGAVLARALFAARAGRVMPGLLIAHAVEALARAGFVEHTQQWAGPLGFQIGRLSPALHRWVESETVEAVAALAA